MLQKLLNSSVQPFRSTPDARFYFDHPSIESARQTAVRAIIRAEGPVVVLGGAGYGKSLLADIVADQLCERLDIVMLQSARLASRRALLQNILFELKMPYRELEEGELRLSILDRLEPSPETAPEGVLIIVDEAHSLPWKLIDELRLISNFTRNHQPRVKLLLLGNMKLEDTLTSPQLESFNQRLAARCYLQPMSKSETIAYVQHQIRLCEVDPAKVITQDALQSVYAASEGIPRLANQLMNHAIWLASNNAHLPISASLINDAWRDLQQLPTPWSTGKADPQSPAATIEFGELSDDADESAEELLSQSPWDTDSLTSSTTVEVGNVFQIANYTASDRLPQETEPSTELPRVDGKGSTTSDVVEYDFSEPETSFFAAFSGTASSQFLNALDESAEDDAWRIAVGKDPASSNSMDTTLAQSRSNVPNSAPGLAPVQSVEFNWFAPNRHEVPIVVPTSELPAGESPAISSDAERLMGLIAEQQQYDTMGVWENDPPLSQPSEKLETMGKSKPTDLLNTVFGSDFDEEELLTSNPTRPSTSDGLRVAPASNRSASASDVDGSVPSSKVSDYLVRMQQYAEALSEVARTDSGQSDSVAASPEIASTLAAPAPAPTALTPVRYQEILASSLWSIDVVPNGTGQPVEDAIEDIVSQLNFSAFSIEPFSVEQIPLESPQKIVPEDSIRRGTNDQVYMMHRPTASPQLTVQDFDDDRDLLIIEEDVPVSSRMLDSGIAEHPAQEDCFIQPTIRTIAQVIDSDGEQQPWNSKRWNK